MAFDEQLAQKVRNHLGKRRNIVEKKMMGGLTFMVNDKMCVGVLANKLMCRVGPEIYDLALKRVGAKKMDFTGRPMVGFLFVSKEALKTEKQWAYWIELCLAYNKVAPLRQKN